MVDVICRIEMEFRALNVFNPVKDNTQVYRQIIKYLAKNKNN